MSCLPSSEEWSNETKASLLEDHIEALAYHIESLKHIHSDPQALLKDKAHLIEINQRSLEAYELLMAFEQAASH